MTASTLPDLKLYCQDMARRAKAACNDVAQLSTEQKNQWLRGCSQAIRDRRDSILAANAKDLEAGKELGLNSALLDRLKLTPTRIEEMAVGLDEIADLDDPVGEVIESRQRPNGLNISKIRVPLGVVFFVYESRPNVTVDAAAICVKSGNSVILRGGKEARHSCASLVELLREEAVSHGLPADSIQLVATSDRDAVSHFLSMPEYIDLAIPRGGEGLIRRVVAEAKMPVMKHFAGNCHVFVDKDADLEMAVKIVENSKCQRMGVCNACESLLIHEEVAGKFLPRIGQMLIDHDIEIRGDEKTCDILPSAVPATDEDYFTEFLGPIISVKLVPSLDAGIKHINHYGSHHTDAIVTSNSDSAQRFAARVDSAAVMVNASTRFNDGGQLGLGAEIGISTDKFHARGPCGLKELTTYKYVAMGDGQVRE